MFEDNKEFKLTQKQLNFIKTRILGKDKIDKKFGIKYKKKERRY